MGFQTGFMKVTSNNAFTHTNIHSYLLMCHLLLFLPDRGSFCIQRSHLVVSAGEISGLSTNQWHWSSQHWILIVRKWPVSHHSIYPLSKSKQISQWFYNLFILSLTKTFIFKFARWNIIGPVGLIVSFYNFIQNIISLLNCCSAYKGRLCYSQSKTVCNWCRKSIQTNWSGGTEVGRRRVCPSYVSSFTFTQSLTSET